MLDASQARIKHVSHCAALAVQRHCTRNLAAGIGNRLVKTLDLNIGYDPKDLTQVTGIC